MSAAPLRHTHYSWRHFMPGGYVAKPRDGLTDARNGSLESYDEYLLSCGHHLLLPPSKEMIWEHRCKACVASIDRKGEV